MTSMMPAQQARRWLEQAGVPFTRWEVVASRSDAHAAAQRFGGRLALKTAAADVVHKSDMGCVELDVDGAEAAGLAYERIVTQAGRAGSADAAQVMVEQMVPKGIAEVLIGIVRDPTFGPVLLVGLGGIWVEVMHDVSRRLCPVTTDEAQAMFDGLKGAALLQGGRGRMRADIQALARLASQLSELAMREPRIEQLDLNPVIALGSGALAVDARIALKDQEERDVK